VSTWKGNEFMSDTSKPIECTEDQELLAEAYALLRQQRFLLRPAAVPMTPRGAEEMREALKDFLERYERRLFPRKAGALPMEGRE
jgi:hypothetical protein